MAAILLAAACGAPPPGAGRVVRDDLARTVAVPDHPRRVVSLAPNLTELIYYAGAGDRLVATDDFSNFPAAAAKLRKVGGVAPSVELIIAAKPDLVIGSSSAAHVSLAAALRRAAIPIYIARTDRIADVPRVARNLGLLLGVDATRAAARLAGDSQAVMTLPGPKPRVLFLVWPEPLYVAGRETFADDVIRLAGGSNAVTVHGWPQYSLEAVLASPPDVIVFPDRSVSSDLLARTFAADPRWRSLAVVKRRALYPVVEDLFVRPGPRFGAAVVELHRILERQESSK